MLRQNKGTAQNPFSAWILPIVTEDFCGFFISPLQACSQGGSSGCNAPTTDWLHPLRIGRIRETNSNVNSQLDAAVIILLTFQSAQLVSGDNFAHPQER